MSRIVDIRRPVAFAVMAVLFFAALAPVCLMAPTVAMGMTSGSMSASENSCERGAADGSMTACPYNSNNDGTGTVPQDKTPAPAVGPVAAPAPALADFRSVPVSSSEASAAPPGAPVPLRL